MNFLHGFLFVLTMVPVVIVLNFVDDFLIKLIPNRDISFGISGFLIFITCAIYLYGVGMIMQG